MDSAASLADGVRACRATLTSIVVGDVVLYMGLVAFLSVLVGSCDGWQKGLKMRAVGMF